jgi:hypothetical protein
MKTVNYQTNTYQRQQFLQFLINYRVYRLLEKFTDQNFRQLLFFSVVNAIQIEKHWTVDYSNCGCGTIMKDVPFRVLSFLTYSNAI